MRFRTSLFISIAGFLAIVGSLWGVVSEMSAVLKEAAAVRGLTGAGFVVGRTCLGRYELCDPQPIGKLLSGMLLSCGCCGCCASDGLEVASLGTFGPANAPSASAPPRTKLLRWLGDIRVLKGLYLDGIAINDSDVEQVCRIGTLKEIGLRGTAITDNAGTFLGRLHDLTTLDLSHTNFGDRGVVFLANAPNLRTLNLEATLVTDAGIIALKSSPHLSHLYVKSTRVSAAVADEVSHCTGVRILIR
jgi:hypothetical protein